MSTYIYSCLLLIFLPFASLGQDNSNPLSKMMNKRCSVQRVRGREQIRGDLLYRFLSSNTKQLVVTREGGKTIICSWADLSQLSNVKIQIVEAFTKPRDYRLDVDGSTLNDGVFLFVEDPGFRRINHPELMLLKIK
jgi:hypothetical protein